jgi:O-antigen/teichoic acid export membrane protein
MLNKIFNTFSVKFASAVINLLIAIVVSRYLGAAGKGEQSIILTTITLILIFENIAGGAVLVYLTPRFKTSLLIYISYLWSILIGMVFCIILSYVNLIDKEYIFSVCILSVINSFAANNSNILLGKKKINKSNYVLFSQPVLTIVSLFLFLIILKYSTINAYLYSLYIAYSLGFIFSFLLLRMKNSNDNPLITDWKLTFKTMFGMGFYNQLSHITALLNMRLSYYLLEKYQGAEALGVYSNGVSLTEAIWMVSGSMAMVQYSHISNSDDRIYAQKLTVDMTKISLLVTLILLIPMLLLPSVFYTFIFGKDFNHINYIMLCLAPGVFFYNFALLIGHYFSGTGRYYINTTTSAIGLVITLLLSFYAIPKWGFYGAGLVSSISYIFVAVSIIWFFCKESKMGFMQLFPSYGDIKGYVSGIKSLF